MTSLSQNFLNPNNKPLTIGEFNIRQDEDGRYCINDLHKASGDLRKDRPSYFLENEKTQDLIQAIKDENYDVGNSASYIEPVNIVRGRGKEQGTYVVRELVYSYGMWISAKFHLTVIRAYDAMAMQTKINSRQVITPEQKDTLQKIVDHKANGNNGLRPQIWIRHNRHFKINSYHELLAIHFEDAVKYLLEMDVKQKPQKQEVKTLPYSSEAIHVAQEISQEFQAGRYESWFVGSRNGTLSVMPLPHGYYPSMDVAEFTRRFDSLLDLLYGSDVLLQGRHFLKERNIK